MYRPPPSSSLTDIGNTIQMVGNLVALPVGILGNIFVILVLTRPAMRTNSASFYFTALAIADQGVLLSAIPSDLLGWNRLGHGNSYNIYTCILPIYFVRVCGGTSLWLASGHIRRGQVDRCEDAFQGQTVMHSSPGGWYIGGNLYRPVTERLPSTVDARWRDPTRHKQHYDCHQLWLCVWACQRILDPHQPSTESSYWSTTTHRIGHNTEYPHHPWASEDEQVCFALLFNFNVSFLIEFFAHWLAYIAHGRNITITKAAAVLSTWYELETKFK